MPDRRGDLVLHLDVIAGIRHVEELIVERYDVTTATTTACSSQPAGRRPRADGAVSR
jgi:hypothetical protein